MDSVDLAILKILGQDGRTSNREIARRIGVSEGTVRQHLKRLNQEGRFRVTAQVDIESVPDVFIGFVGMKIDGRQLSECAEQISALPSVLSTMLVTGRYDLVAIVLASSHKTLVEFVTDQLSQIKGVKDSETFVALKNIGQWISIDAINELILDNL